MTNNLEEFLHKISSTIGGLQAVSKHEETVEAAVGAQSNANDDEDSLKQTRPGTSEEEEVVEPEEEQPLVTTFDAAVKIDPEDMELTGVKTIQSTLQQVPTPLLDKLVSEGFTLLDVTMLYGKQADLSGMLLEAHYDPSNKSILVGHDHPIQACIPWSLLHCLGQAVYDILAKDKVKTEVAKLHGQNYDKLNPFEQQDKPGSELGAKVYFSQAWAMAVVNVDQARAQYGDTMIEIVDDYLSIEAEQPPEEEQPIEAPDVDQQEEPDETETP